MCAKIISNQDLHWEFELSSVIEFCNVSIWFWYPHALRIYVYRNSVGSFRRRVGCALGDKLAGTFMHVAFQSCHMDSNVQLTSLLSIDDGYLFPFP